MIDDNTVAQLREISRAAPDVTSDDYAVAAGAAAASLAYRLSGDREAALLAAGEPLERNLIGPYLDALTGAAYAAISEAVENRPDAVAAIAEHLRRLAAAWQASR